MAETIRLHIKLLVEPDAGLEALIGQAGEAYFQHGLGLEIVSVDDVSAMAGAEDLLDLEVGDCPNGPATAQQEALFSHACANWTGWVAHEAPEVGLRQGLATISRNPSVINVYARGGDNALWQRGYWDGEWHPWGRHDDGGVLASIPALGSMGPDHEHVFVRGTDGQVWQKWWTGGGGWSGWVQLGAPEVGMVEGPSTISRDPSVCNLYVRGEDDALWQRAYYEGQWHPWGRHDDGGVLRSIPAVDSMAPDHEHVFVRGTDGQVWQKWWTAGGGWSGWVSLGAPDVGFVGAPSTISRGPGLCNLYVRGTDDALWSRGYWGGEWHPWGSHADPGLLAEVPAPGATGPDEEHVFILAADGQAWQRWWLGPTRAQDIVVFVVGGVSGPGGPLAGSASHPPGRPGIVLSQNAPAGALADELGHLLGLPHGAASAETPASLTPEQVTTISASPLLA